VHNGDSGRHGQAVLGGQALVTEENQLEPRSRPHQLSVQGKGDVQECGEICGAVRVGRHSAATWRVSAGGRARRAPPAEKGQGRSQGLRLECRRVRGEVSGERTGAERGGS
jgi:hypothetical protein